MNHQHHLAHQQAQTDLVETENLHQHHQAHLYQQQDKLDHQVNEAAEQIVVQALVEEEQTHNLNMEELLTVDHQVKAAAEAAEAAEAVMPYRNRLL